MLNESDVSSDFSSSSGQSEKAKTKVEPIGVQPETLYDKNYMEEFDQLFDMQKK
jgi:hypothetical protein|tara:strand:- start:262 stop:423 length:162 start_codon:yes stop_codon:yes gene_type:complete